MAWATRRRAGRFGDDRQLAAIDAGGGFRALRLRLGASELTENRRQHQAWEREALELVRSGLVEEAVAAYRAHDRVVAAESKPAATLALLQDSWQAWQDAERDPAEDVIVLAGRRAEVDRLNSACQQLLAARAASAPIGSRSRTSRLRWGIGWCAAATPSPSWGWPMAPAAPSPLSTRSPAP
jgi:ATP-dependent exoDNAse (exonuclease V) alpha subunit